MPELPQGTVTLLFTDIEGSTRLLQRLGDGYAEALAEHRRVLREAFIAHGGVEVETQGDAFLVAFARASDAVAAGAEGQAALEGSSVRVRMGLHTGEPRVTEEGYVGIDVHRAARIAAAGHGGQVLLSRTTRDLVVADVRDLGDHRLKDLSGPERLYQLGGGDFPRLNALYETNLPVQPSPLVGRERELNEITAFIRGGMPLLTLTGAGGSGKTRLALHAAAEVAGDFPDGVWFVPLAATIDPQVVEPTIAEVVGARGDLRTFLRGKHVLLVLDNLEQLLPAVAERVAELPTQVIATSRERLALSDEQEYEVAPLGPQDAVSLFVQRARRLLPAFEPDEHVDAVVRRVDGLPLAVELAAARVKVLSTAQIAQRLARSLDLLSTSARDVPARQRTVRAAIEWSYQLLTAEERRVLRALAAFRGSFSLPAAEEVADSDLDRIAALVDRSLVRRTDDERLFMLETIREFALGELVNEGEAEAVRERHAAFYERWLPDTYASRNARSPVYGEAPRELDNIRAVVAWVLDHGDGERALGTVARAAALWEMRGLDHEAGEWLARALPLSYDASPARADALLESAEFARRRGDHPAAAVLGAEALAITRCFPDEVERLVDNLDRVACGLAERGDIAGARARFEEAVSLRPQRRRTIGNYGGIEMLAGNYERAQELLEKALALAPVADTTRMLALHSLGDLALRGGDLERARARYRESLEVSDALGLAGMTVVYCAGGLAAAAAAGGDRETAARLWGAVERLENEWGPITTYERAFYAETVGDVSAHPANVDGRILPAEEARRLFDAYAASPELSQP